MTAEPEPHFCSVKAAAAVLDLKPARVYQLLDDGHIESRYIGRLRKVVVASLNDYIHNLPSSAPVDEVA